MIEAFLEIIEDINLFDFISFLILLYCVIQCFLKGFSLSLISFMKWVISTIVTIVLVPKFQPVVSEYIESEFFNQIGLGIAIFIITLFITIVLGKALSRAVTWTGVGSIDKTFGLLFGFFKGYIVSVCIFSILNWCISADEALTFNIINKGSRLLIEEFPSSKDFIDTKEKIEKI